MCVCAEFSPYCLYGNRDQVIRGAWWCVGPRQTLWNLPNMECSIVQEPKAGGKEDMAGGQQTQVPCWSLVSTGLKQSGQRPGVLVRLMMPV